MKRLYYVIVPIVAYLVIRTTGLGIASTLLTIATVAFILSRLDRILGIFGNISYINGKREKAMKLYKMGAEIPFATQYTQLTYAYLLVKSGETELAEQCVKRIEKKGIKTHDKTHYYAITALIAFRKGDLPLAIETLETAHQKSFRNSTTYSSLGYMYILTGDLEKALQVNLEAYDYNKSNKVILDNLGDTYYLLGDFKKAEEIFIDLLKGKPDFPEPYYHYASVLEKKGEIENALEQCKNALLYEFTALSSINKTQVNEKIAALEGVLLTQPTLHASSLYEEEKA
ncbi:MAG: tetratricopeptide repeat protein [Hyphomonadaceae bacterium]|nr:tetratricopeptide repeat protein [Clostridia bacterium]